jgi:hypothetical protein
MASVVEPHLKTRRWRRVEYERLVDLGIFVGERLELLDGLLVVREPQGAGTPRDYLSARRSRRLTPRTAAPIGPSTSCDRPRR